MMSHEYPPQLDPPSLRRTPKGPPEIALRLSDFALARTNSRSWPSDMWPYFARSHLMIVSGLLELHAAPGFGVGEGEGVGEGVTTGAGVTKLWVSDQALVAFESKPRTRSSMRGSSDSISAVNSAFHCSSWPSGL